MRSKPVRHTLRGLAALAFLALLALASAGCASSPTGVAALVGRYELRSVDGRLLPDERLGGAISGELTLQGNGRATRVVTYARSGLPTPFVQQTTGVYRVRGSQITLTLSERPRSTLGSPWQVSGEVQGQSLVFRYPGPADGATEERFVRVSP